MKFSASLFSVALFLILFTPQSASADTLPVSCVLSPQQITVASGGSFTLTWHSTSTTEGTITGVGPVPPNGSIELAPLASTQFTGTFWGPAGTSTCTASLTVTGNVSGSSSSGNSEPDFSDSESGFSASNSTVANNPGNTDPNQLVPCDGPDCQACNVVDLAQRIINFMLGLSIPIVILLFVYAGFLYFSSAANEGNISKAKGIFRDAFIGFLIALGAYLIIDTLLHTILSDEFYDDWNSVACDVGNRPMDATVGELLGGANSTPGTGISVESSPNASGVGTVILKPGVSLAGVKQSTMDYANAVALQCGCNIVITAGTDGTHEAGTYSHANGYKIDIRSQGNTDLGNWVAGNGIPGARSNGDPTYTMGNVTWALENQGTSNEHWDVQVKP